MNRKSEVVLTDLDAAAKAFRHAANEMTHVSPISAIRVDSGDPGLDQAIHTALRMVQSLHFSGASGLLDTSEKLTAARKAYEATDQTIRELYDDLMKVDLTPRRKG